MASTEPIENGSVNLPEPNAQPGAQTATVASETDIATTNLAAEVQTEAIAEADLAEKDSQPTTSAVEAPTVDTETAQPANNEVKAKWPGWPGNCVFRLVVPVLKVGSIIGRKGDLIKKMCEETRARIRVLDGPVSSPDRIVLITGKEEPDAPLSPAMDATIRVFKRVNGLPEDGSNTSGAATGTHCSVRLLVASTQAINLIGKQGSLIKSIQESTGAVVRVLSNDEMPIYANSDERIVEVQGEAFKVLKALESIVGHLRKFLVDHSVLPLFERGYNTPVAQERPVEPWSDKTSLHSSQQSGLPAEYSHSLKRDSLFLDHESLLEPQPYSAISLYGQDPAIPSFRPPALGRVGGPVVTQVSQTMQIPLTYAEDIIGAKGANIAYIRRTSGAILTVQESGGLRDEITVEIKGTTTQVQTAQQLIQDFISGHKDTYRSSYGNLESSGLRSSYSQLGSSSSYTPSSFSGQSYGGYGSSGVGGGYSSSSFRL